MDKIIFLDIDGVLNSDEWNEEHKEDMESVVKRHGFILTSSMCF